MARDVDDGPPLGAGGARRGVTLVTPRRRSRELEPLHGEVVEPPPVEARAVVRRERAVVESVAGLPAERHVTNNYYVQAPAPDVEPVRESVPPWVRVLALVICLAAAVYLTVVVLAYLHVGGPWDVAPHVKGTGR